MLVIHSGAVRGVGSDGTGCTEGKRSHLPQNMLLLLLLPEVECQTCRLEQRSLANRCRATSPPTANPVVGLVNLG